MGSSPDSSDPFLRTAEQVRRAALAGAKQVTYDHLVVREAIEKALEKLEDHWIQGKTISDPGSWGFKVGRHAAIRSASKQRVGHLPDVGDLVTRGGNLRSSSQLKRALARRSDRLTEKQHLAVRAWLRHGSVKGAARALGKDASGVRRLLWRALERLRGRGS